MFTKQRSVSVPALLLPRSSIPSCFLFFPICLNVCIEVFLYTHRRTQAKTNPYFSLSVFVKYIMLWFEKIWIKFFKNKFNRKWTENHESLFIFNIFLLKNTNKCLFFIFIQFKIYIFTIHTVSYMLLSVEIDIYGWKNIFCWSCFYTNKDFAMQ